MNGYADYYTTKGSGSQTSYDAYYDDYGTSAVWSQINADTLSNIASTRGVGDAEFVTTHESIETALNREDRNIGIFLLIGGFLAYKFFF